MLGHVYDTETRTALTSEDDVTPSSAPVKVIIETRRHPLGTCYPSILHYSLSKGIRLTILHKFKNMKSDL